MVLNSRLCNYVGFGLKGPGFKEAGLPLKVEVEVKQKVRQMEMKKALLVEAKEI